MISRIYEGLFKWVDFMVEVNTSIFRTSFSLFHESTHPLREIFCLKLSFGLKEAPLSIHLRLYHPSMWIIQSIYCPAFEAIVLFKDSKRSISTRGWIGGSGTLVKQSQDKKNEEDKLNEERKE